MKPLGDEKSKNEKIKRIPDYVLVPVPLSAGTSENLQETMMIFQFYAMTMSTIITSVTG